MLYDLWLRRGWPKVERATGPVDVAHATTLIPCATDAPMVVTVHDLAFLHDPSHFTRRGNSIFRRSLEQIRRRADLVLCSSEATMDDCVAAGIPGHRLRLVPLGVDAAKVDAAEGARVMALYHLPQRYLLFVGTVEPRKNLRGLVQAIALLDEPLPLVVAGAEGWGDIDMPTGGDVRFIGFVPAADLSGLYAGAEVFCYPSEREGYGLPVLEAMAQGTPVVTSRGTATEETAGGAAVLVDPADPADIARGIAEACGASSRPGDRGYGSRRQGDVAGDGAPDCCGLSGAVLMADPSVAVNLLWCVPGDVGGSEEYLVRQLLGLAEAAPQIRPTLYVVDGFVEAHPDLAALFPTVVASFDGASRGRRIAGEVTWFRRRTSAADLRHHGGGTAPLGAVRPYVLTIHDLQYRTYPEYFSRKKRTVPCGRASASPCAELPWSPCRATTCAPPSSTPTMRRRRR